MMKETLKELLVNNEFIEAEDIETGDYRGYFGYDEDKDDMYFIAGSYKTYSNDNDYIIWDELEAGLITLNY